MENGREKQQRFSGFLYFTLFLISYFKKISAAFFQNSLLFPRFFQISVLSFLLLAYSLVRRNDLIFNYIFVIIFS